VTWYADPAGARERYELRLSGLTVHTGVNDVRLGIMAVAARGERGGLKGLEGRCPNLLYEAGVGRYGDRRGGGAAPGGRANPPPRGGVGWGGWRRGGWGGGGRRRPGRRPRRAVPRRPSAPRRSGCGGRSASTCWGTARTGPTSPETEPQMNADERR